MRDYGKVHTSFWTSENLRAVSDDARMLAMYLLTCPHGTIAGVFRLPDGYITDDMQWKPERVAEGFQELFANGFANRCETSKWVWVFKHFEWNPPENPNQRKAVRKIASQVPDQCTWKAQYYAENAEMLGVEQEPSANPSVTVPQPVAVAVAVTGAVVEATKGSPSAAASGQRLPADWQPDASLIAWANDARPDVDVKTETAAFIDFWMAKPGKDGRKSDWPATFRNWIRRAHASAKPRPSNAPTQGNSPAAGRPFE